MKASALHPDSFQFLTALAAHNHKDWLDQNRPWYQEVRQGLIDFAGQLHEAMATVAAMPMIEARRCVGRINNNRRFHPDKPPYKTHFGLMLKRGPGRLDFYLHLEPGASFVGAGLYHPAREPLLAFRQKVDREGARLTQISQAPALLKHYGAISGESLKRSPRDYPADHPYLDFLKLKDIVLTRAIPQSELFKESFLLRFRDYFAAALPLLEFLDEALDSVADGQK